MVFSLFSSSFLLGQTFFFKGGLNIANLTSTFNGKSQGTTGMTGFLIGGSGQIHLDENFLVESGLLFSTKGGYDDNYEESMKFTYLEIPFRVKRYFPIDKYSFFGALGFQTNILLGGTGIADFGTRDADTYKISENIGSNSLFKRLDNGFSFGSGFKVNKFEIGLSYYLGLSNIRNNDTSVLKNRVLGISVGYDIFTKH